MRLAAIALLAAASASALPPDWDRRTLTPSCPFCGATLSWGYESCNSCQAAVEWKLPGPPGTAAEAWRFLAAAVAHKDADFVAELVEGDAAENLRALSIAPLASFARSSKVEGGERVVAVSLDRGTTLVLRWKGGKFGAEREAHRPLKNQVEAARMLKSAVAAERKLREGDLDFDLEKNYWTGDWSGLARLAGKDGKPLGLIPDEAAAADLRPLPASPDAAPPVPRPRLGAAPAPAPWHGYRFASLESDETGRKFGEATNPDRFAFVALPAEPGVTGWLTLVVSEDGAVWGKELGDVRDAGSAAASPEEAAAIAAAIRELDAEAFEAREAAEGKLRAFGRKARPAMEEALKAAAPEPKRRLRGLLSDLEEDGPDLRRWPAGSKDLLDAGWERL